MRSPMTAETSGTAQLWRRIDQFVGTEIEDSFVILDVERAAYFSFNPSAKEIWNLLEEPISIDGIADHLTARYDVSRDVCTQSIERLLSRFSDKGLVHPIG